MPPIASEAGQPRRYRQARAAATYSFFVAPSAPHQRFAGLTYDSFQCMARDPTLSVHERSGFPDAYREGTEDAILADIGYKLPALGGRGATVVDIGCGASALAMAIRTLCLERGHELVLIDGPDVLAHQADGEHVHKLAGRFPDIPGVLDEWGARCDVVLAYSVLQYVFVEASIFSFLDAALRLLRPGGRALLADVPNASMRRRFLASEAGRRHHREYMATDRDPELTWPELPVDQPDDAVALALLTRARDAGFHGWVLPQPDSLPMANRREDLLFARP
jgi:SAM-dependent methyltransferase